MIIDSINLVSIDEANQNFSEVARKADENGPVIILKNNRPKYLLIEFSEAAEQQIASEEDIKTISDKHIEENKRAYKLLAK